MIEALSVVEQAVAVSSSPRMSRQEARQLVNGIKADVANARRKFLDLYVRRGWQALGYPNWRECVTNEFGWSEAYSYRLLSAAKTEIGISGIQCHFSPIGEKDEIIPESHLRPLARLSPDRQREAWRLVLETAPDGKVTASHVKSIVGTVKPLESHQLINQSTNNEWYTPAPYIEAAREVMGGIDLDPASNEYANRVVKADVFFTERDDGFTQKWWGRVWLNPPYGFRDDGEGNQAAWSGKLIGEYGIGRVEQALLLVNAVPGNRWFAPLWDFPICFVDHRIRFYNEEVEAGQPTHSNAIVYMGQQESQFVKVFSRFGPVAKRISPDES